jgi:CRP-like cAMP-binding protein
VLRQTNKRPVVKNALLSNFSISDFAATARFLESIRLQERMILHDPRQVVEHVYFIESGLSSLRIIAAGAILETAVVGYRGAVGASFLFGSHVRTQQSVVLFPGSALRIHIKDLRRLMVERPWIRDELLQYVLALDAHVAQAGFCAVRHKLEARLANWLCMASDALDGHNLPVTHDYFSVALGLRRPSVTEALIRFEEQGLIRKGRGFVQVCKRKELELRACSCYGAIAGTYASFECPSVWSMPSNAVAE